MKIKSNLGYKKENGEYVYSNSIIDGNPFILGKLLLNFFNTKELVEKVVKNMPEVIEFILNKKFSIKDKHIVRKVNNINDIISEEVLWYYIWKKNNWYYSVDGENWNILKSIPNLKE